MLKSTLLHPQILEVLGRAGHGSKVLIADGNYPAATTLGPNATLVSLNLAPGVVTCTQILTALAAAIPIEAAAVMDYARTSSHALEADPPIWTQFREILRETCGPADLERIERFAFYRAAAQPDVCLAIASADQRIYANLMLTIGVVKAP
jgi:L-fucose mutarotase